MFLAENKSHPSTSKGSSPKEPTIPMSLAPREGVVEFIRSRNIFCRFALVISCNPNGYPFVHDHVPPGCRRYVERQRREAILPSRQPGTFKEDQCEIAASRVKCYQKRSQRCPPTGGSVDYDIPQVGELTDTDTDNRATTTTRAPTTSRRRSRPFSKGVPCGQ